MNRTLPLAAIGLTVLIAALVTVYAADLSTWTTDFEDATIVVGSAKNEMDIAAATKIAETLGISATTTEEEVTEEYKIERSTDRLNVGDNISSIKSSVDDDELPTLLADGTYRDADNTEYDYTQKVIFGSGLTFKHFADKDYKDEEPTLGFAFDDDTVILNYTLDFKTNPDFTAAKLETTTITIMGHEYYISDVSSNKIVLLDSANTGIVSEGETATIGGHEISIEYISSSEVKLVVDGETTNSLSEGETYKLSDGTYVGVKDIMYNAKDTGISKVEVSVGKGKIEIPNGNYVEINDEPVLDLIGYSGNSSGKWSGITLQWKLNEEDFLTTEEDMVFPGFETLKLKLKDIVFPEEEKVTIDGGSTYLKLTVPIESGEATLNLLYLNSTGTGFAGIGKDSTHKLVTTTGNYLVFNKTAGDEWFVASYKSSKEAESYLLTATIWTDGTNNKTTIRDVVSGKDVCKELVEGDDCEIGDVSFTINDIHVVGSNKWINITAGSGVEFDMIYTKEGLGIYLPHTTSGTTGYINLSAQPSTYQLYMKEEDKDGTILNGDTLNFTIGISNNNKVSVTGISADWSGNNYFEDPNNDDHYIGYVESDLATKVEWDKSKDEYDAEVTYHGEEVYGELYISAIGAITTTPTKVYVLDSDVMADTSAYADKALIVIGGSAANEVAAELLGLSFPTYGYESGWQDATGVDDETYTGIVKIFEEPAIGKLALLVAGYDADDTATLGDIMANWEDYTDDIFVEGNKEFRLSPTGEPTLVGAA